MALQTCTPQLQPTATAPPASGWTWHCVKNKFPINPLGLNFQMPHVRLWHARPGDFMRQLTGNVAVLCSTKWKKKSEEEMWDLLHISFVCSAPCSSWSGNNWAERHPVKSVEHCLKPVCSTGGRRETWNHLFGFVSLTNLKQSPSGIFQNFFPLCCKLFH